MVEKQQKQSKGEIKDEDFKYPALVSLSPGSRRYIKSFLTRICDNDAVNAFSLL